VICDIVPPAHPAELHALTVMVSGFSKKAREKWMETAPLPETTHRHLSPLRYMGGYVFDTSPVRADGAGVHGQVWCSSPHDTLAE